MVLQDWVRGRIPFFTPPPQTDDAKRGEVKAATAATPGPKPSADTTPETDEQKAAAVTAAAIAEVIAKQKVRKVPMKENFFDVDDARPEGVVSSDADGEDEEMASDEENDEEDDEVLVESSGGKHDLILVLSLLNVPRSVKDTLGSLKIPDAVCELEWGHYSVPVLVAVKWHLETRY
jgi:nuclear GTP-binding protein